MSQSKFRNPAPPHSTATTTTTATLKPKSRTSNRVQPHLQDSQPPPQRLNTPSSLFEQVNEGESSAKILAKIEKKMSRKLDELSHLVFDIVSVSPFSHEEITNLAVAAITSTSHPNDEGTVNDRRLGSLDTSSHCNTCKLTEACPGHYGYIPFAKPIFNPIYMRDGTITHILNAICGDCLRTYMTPEQVKNKGHDLLTREKRLRALSADTYNACPRTTIAELQDSNTKPCGVPRRFNHSASKEHGRAFYGSHKESLDAEAVLDMFRHVSDESAQLMGFKDASILPRLIMRSMLVPPVQVRPPRVTNGVPYSNDLTTQLNSIVDANVKLQEAIADAKVNIHGDTSVSNAATNLYKAVAEYQKMMSDEIQGKEGRVRGELMRKPGDFCARAVLGPASDVAMDQVAVPYRWKYELTPIVTVTENNIDYVFKLAELGKVTYITTGPGKPDSGMRRLYMPEICKIAIGDRVERHLEDGDIVIINRQPTLHKHNLIGLRAVLQDRNTLGIHLALTPSMHADFDGDEADLWPAVSTEARDEVLNRMYVCHNIITSKSNQPIVHPVYDSYTSSYLLTAPIHKGGVVRVPLQIFYDALMTIDYGEDIEDFKQRLSYYGIPIGEPDELMEYKRTLLESNIWNENVAMATEMLRKLLEYNRWMADNEQFQQYKQELMNPKLWIEQPVIAQEKLRRITQNLAVDGRALFSILLPSDFNYDSSRVVVRDGIVISGIIADVELGSSHRSFVQELHKFYSSTTAAEFITNSTRVLRIFVDYFGFTISLSDCNYDQFKTLMVNDPEGGAKQITIKEAIENALAQAEVEYSALGPRTGDPIRDREREIKIMDIVDRPRSVGLKLISELSKPENNIIISSKLGGGAKGSALNTLQMVLFLGQQYYNKERMKEIVSGERTLVTFRPGEDTLKSHGFVTESFSQGLTPTSFFFHSSGAREGLADTAVTTPSVGQLQRSITKSTESIITFPDTSVRTHDDRIIQFAYGEDGFDAAHLIRVGTPSMKERACFTDVKTLAIKVNSKYGWVRSYTKN